MRSCARMQTPAWTLKPAGTWTPTFLHPLCVSRFSRHPTATTLRDQQVNGAPSLLAHVQAYHGTNKGVGNISWVTEWPVWYLRPWLTANVCLIEMFVQKNLASISLEGGKRSSTRKADSRCIKVSGLQHHDMSCQCSAVHKAFNILEPSYPTVSL